MTMTRRYRHWTMAELNRAAAMRKDGMSYSAIGRALDRRPYAVSTILRKHGMDSNVPLSHESARYRTLMRRAIVLRNQRIPYTEIADAIGWHATPTALRQGVIRYARRYNLPLYRSKETHDESGQ